MCDVPLFGSLDVARWSAVGHMFMLWVSLGRGVWCGVVWCGVVWCGGADRIDFVFNLVPVSTGRTFGVMYLVIYCAAGRVVRFLRVEWES